MRDAGITAAAVSWWGRPTVATAHDGEGVSTDELIPVVLRAAEAQRMRVVFHLEPYEGRTPDTVRLDIEVRLIRQRLRIDSQKKSAHGDV